MSDVYVIFTTAVPGKSSWWSVFVGRWSHCIYITEFDCGGHGSVYLSEYSRGRVETFNFFRVNAREYTDLVMGTSGSEVIAIVQVNTEVLANQNRMEYIPGRMLTCVEYVKANIGIRNWFVWTPKQLFKTLESQGGIVQWVVKEEGDPVKLNSN